MLARTSTLAPSLILLLASACGGPSLRIEHQQAPDEEARFVAYQTWSYAGTTELPDGYVPEELPPAAQEIAAEVGLAALEERGWSRASEEEADILFLVGVGRRVTTSTELALQDPTSAFPARGSSFTRHVVEEQRTLHEGTLIVNAIDRTTRDVVWHGHIEAVLTSTGAGEYPTPEQQARFRQAMTELMHTFPNAGAGESL